MRRLHPIAKLPSAQAFNPQVAGFFSLQPVACSRHMKILVTGISGFVGSQLAPALIERGHDVVALARDPKRIDPELRGKVEVVRGNALSGDALSQALVDCDAFAWLLHSMEPDSSGIDYSARELNSVRRAIEAAQRSGVERCAYLGGIVPSGGPTSQHLDSRLAVERELLSRLPQSTALRASIVIGAGSRSFRFLVRLIERLPAMPLPAWHSNRTAPADIRDTVEALVRSLEGEAPGRSLDIACNEVLSYGELIERIADRMLLDRPTIGLPFSLTPIAGRVAAVLAGEQTELIVPLMGSLGDDLIPRNDGLAELGIKPHRLDAAIDCALREWEAVEELAAR